MKSLVIIPTYNESENILKIIEAILRQKIDGLDVLVIDDNSPDGTGGIVEEIAGPQSRVKLIKRPTKSGLGTAYVRGFKYALEHGYDRVIEMDADFSHDPAELSNLLKASQTYDIVLGSRYIHGVNVVNWPLSRLILSMGASLYTKLVTGLPVKDCTSGFKCFRREVLQNLNLDQVQSDGYSFQIELNFKAWKKGFTLGEVPIIFIDRRAGTSKMSRKIVWEAVWMVWKLKFMSLFGKI
ncbi:MAG: polyprenol monophosphomannose synthase [candidate division KSB1 bacterium]|nr:polyprenol monophosphomannose synthase [candidate division KSB1 bacterium]